MLGLHWGFVLFGCSKEPATQRKRQRGIPVSQFGELGETNQTNQPKKTKTNQTNLKKKQPNQTNQITLNQLQAKKENITKHCSEGQSLGYNDEVVAAHSTLLWTVPKDARAPFFSTVLAPAKPKKIEHLN